MASVYRPIFVRTDRKTGRKVKKRLRKWYAKYRDPDGRVYRIPGYTDNEATKELVRRLERKAAREKEGMTDKFEEYYKVPLSQHLEVYRNFMEGKNNHPRHVSQTIAQCHDVLDGTSYRFIGDLEPGKVAEWLAGQRREGMSISTSNHYLTAIKGFTRWLNRHGRAATDPLAILSRLNADADIRRQRRPLDITETLFLLGTTRLSNRAFRGLNGADRFFLYALAMQTGLRASELASLHSPSFDLTSDPPNVLVKAAYAKNRKQALQPLPAQMAKPLANYLGHKPEDKPVWPGTWHLRAYRMIGLDLAEARNAWIDEARENPAERKKREESDFLARCDKSGRVVDFHATRHSYITLLVKSGVHPKMAQSLARHSSINLTMNTYTHIGLYDQAAALEALPSFLPIDKQPNEELPATGTESAHVLQYVPTIGISCDSVTTSETAEGDGGQTEGCCKPLEMKPFDNDCDRLTLPERRVGEGTRTPDIQSHSLTL